MNCFARVTRALLGHPALNEDKLKCEHPLGILGVKALISAERITLWPSENKVEKWLAHVRRALHTGLLPAGEAGKLAGQLAFACQYTFNRLGRALLRFLYAQQHKPLKGAKVSKHLRLALLWWEQALLLKLCKSVELVPEQESVIELFADARGTPPQIGAVLIEGGSIEYTEWVPPKCVLTALKERRDEQIMAQELLAITVALFSFMDRIRGRRVRVWTDNAGGEGGLH